MVNTNNNKTTPCKECNKDVEPLEQFPNELCFECYRIKEDKKPITKPDFIRAINK